MSKTATIKARSPRKKPPRGRVTSGLLGAVGGFSTGARPARTVTLSRADYEALVEAAEDRIDLARHRAIMRTAKPSDFIPIEMVEARLAGENLLRSWRKQRGLTLVQLAAASGLSHAFLSLLENGKKEATTTTLKKLAAALKVEPGDLI